MKVYIAADTGHEHFHILGVFVERKKAEQLADKRTLEILEEWKEDWGENSRWHNKAMLESGPHDMAVVHEYEVQ